MNPIAKTATDAYGKKIRVGDYVRLLGEGILPIVQVTQMHRQGYDGTILTTAPAPDPDYPHHFTGAAKRFTRIA